MSLQKVSFAYSVPSPQQQQQAQPFVLSPDNEIFQFGELVTAELTYYNQKQHC